MRKLILRHGLDIGDVAMVTIAVRDLHMAYPGKYETSICSRWPDLWLNNPYVKKHYEPNELPSKEDYEGDVEILDLEYWLINNPGSQAFADSFRLDLAKQLKINIPYHPKHPMNVDLHLTDEEKDHNIVREEFGYSGRYWMLNAGYKADIPLKHYPFWQEVVELLKNKIQIVQVGSEHDVHDDLENVFNLVGKTSLRDFIKVLYWSEGTIGPISMQFVLSSAFNKPSVIVAGGKEPPRWQMYNYHRYLSVCGCLKCAPGNGCWTGKFEDCKSRVGKVPRCFAMISPEEVARNVLLYYHGGLLNF